MRDGIKDQWKGTQEADTSKKDERETRTDGRRSEKVRFEDVAVDEPMFLTGDERGSTGGTSWWSTPSRRGHLPRGGKRGGRRGRR